MTVEVAVLGSPSLISLMVSVAVKHHERRTSSQAADAASRAGSPRKITYWKSGMLKTALIYHDYLQQAGRS